MNEANKSKSQVGILESHICGLMVVLTFFGEHFKVLGVSLYCYPLVLCIFLLLLDKHFRIKKPGRIQLSRIETFATFLIIFATLTLPLASRSVGNQPYTKIVVTALIMLVLAHNCNDEESVDLMLKYALIGIIITAITSGYELVSGQHYYAKVLLDSRLFRMGVGNSFGFQINVNDNASLVSLSIFPVLIVLKKSRAVMRFVCVAVICALLFIATGINSRLALLALMIAGFEFFLLLLISRYTKGRVSKVIFAILLVTCCVFFFASFSSSNFLDIISDSQNFDNDNSRLLFMYWALKSISPVSFVFGNGCGVTQQIIGYSIHSVPIELLCDYGIIVAASFMYYIVKMEYAFTERINRFYNIVFPCFATAFFFVSFCSSSMLRIRPLWCYLIIMWKLYSFEKAKTELVS